jgi:hypothetical protein
VTRVADERVCVIQGPVWAGVCGVRVGPDDVPALLAETRALVAAHKTTVWWVDPDARPADLHERLLDLGLRVADDPVVHALACTSEPAPGPAGVDVHRVDTFDDFLAAIEIAWEGFETPSERREQQRVHLRTEFDAAQEAGVPATFLATLDGRPAGTGRSVYSDLGVFLIAGVVAPWAHGRGVYRALVRARWDDAVARGTPALVTEAIPGTSYPILTRLGFERVCSTRRLEDPR